MTDASRRNSTVQLPRRSASATKALAAELNRRQRQSIEERIKDALTLADRLASLIPQERSGRR